MSKALSILGIIVIIISALVGFSTGAFFGFLISLTAGVCIAMILFAFAQIIENQLDILYQLQSQNDFTRELHKKYIKCSKCNYEYDSALASCPYCGERISN